MLFLTRRPKAGHDTIILHDTVSDTRTRIVLRKTDSGQIRVGIDAPQTVSVARGELLDNDSSGR